MTPKIVLVLMVKNESERIERVLNSAIRHVDYVLLCDTGSTDDTIEKVRHLLLKDTCGDGAPYPQVGWSLKGLPWEGFGPTRTACLRLAAGLLDEEEEWYALFLDGDHELIAPIASDGDHELIAPLDRTKLTEQAHTLYQRDEVRTYKNVRLIRLDTDAKCIGRTHEVWNVTGSALDSADKPTIYDHADGANRGDKHTRDLELLFEDAEDPTVNRARTLFYIGQTYQEMEDLEAAVTFYESRLLEKDDNSEDRWMTRYRIAQCRLGSYRKPGGLSLDSVISAYWEAYNMRPHRAEPLCALAHLYLEQGNNLAAYNLAKWCLDLPYPKEDYLFIEDQVYTWSPHDVLAVASHYLSKPEQGQESAEIVIRQEGRPAPFYWKALQTLSYYVPVADFEWSAQGAPGLAIPETLRTFDGVVYEQSTMCHTDNYEVVRLVNYDHDKGNFFVPKEGEKIRTQNAFRARGGEWTILNPDLNAACFEPARIEGLEDIRLLETDDNIWFTATTCQVKGSEGRSQMVCGKLRDDGWVYGLRPIHYARAQEYEKNWLPFKEVSGNIGEDRGLQVVYSYDPFVILEIDYTGKATEVVSLPARFAGLRFRGGTPPVAIGGGDYLAAVHEVGVRTKGDTVCERIYMHRWLRFNEREGVTAYSDAFCLDHVGVEYAAGLRMCDGNIEVSYGREERETCVIAYDLKKTLASLK